MPVSWEFSSAPLSAAKNRVLAFNGEESVQRGYVFDLLLLASQVNADAAPDMSKKLLRSPRITLTGRRGSGETFSRHGMAASVSYLFSEGDESVFRVILRPRSYRLWLTAHSRIFLSLQLPDILTKVLMEEGLNPGEDFENALRAGYYASRPYTCQYNESSAAFLLRHLERFGAYTFIRQHENGDRLILADEQTPVEKLPVRDNLAWSESHADESVFSLTRTLTATPTKVILRDYSTEQPGTSEGSDSKPGDLHGGGVINLYAGCNMYGEVAAEEGTAIKEKAASTATLLARIRLRAIAAKADRAEGESSVPWLQAGYAVTLGKESFQLVSVRHACTLAADEQEERIVRRARQAGFIPGAAQGYRNAFTCHPLDLGPYTPECETPRPSIQGVVHATVDASANGEYAELDSEGRYKVNFFFPEKVFHSDGGAAAEGNRSIGLRMAQAHAGESSGIHFPLIKGVEVLVGFTDGDPDRPLILNALPNPQHPSIIVDENQQSNMIGTPGGHKINLTDTDGKESMSMETPGGHKIIMSDEAGKRELRLQSPCGGHYLRIREK